MPGVSVKNRPANGRPSVSTQVYQIDEIETIGISGWKFLAAVPKKSDDRIPSVHRADHLGKANSLFMEEFGEFCENPFSSRFP